MDNSDNRPTIYVSSKRQHTQLWRTYRNRGYRIISTWIDLEGSFEVEQIGRIQWPIRLEEATRADFLLFYAHPQDGDHSDCLLEIGTALAASRIVLHVGVSDNVKTRDGDMAAFTYHPRWIRFADLDSAFQYAAQYSAMQSSDAS